MSKFNKSRIIKFLTDVKTLSLKNAKCTLSYFFTQEIMLAEHSSIKDHSFYANGILRTLVNFSLPVCPKKYFMIQNHLREDYEVCDITDHGWFYKSAKKLSQDYERTMGHSISRSSCQRVLKTLVTIGVLRCRPLGKNNKGIPNRTLTYRLNFKVLLSLLNSSPPCEEILRKNKKTRAHTKSITPRDKTIEKLNTSYLLKKGKNMQKEEENGSTIKHSLTVHYRNSLPIGIHSLRSQQRMQAVDLGSCVPNWQEEGHICGVREEDLWRVKKGFEKKWSMRRWWRVRKDKWIKNWKGWCNNWVQKFQETFGAKRKRYAILPACHRTLNDSGNNSVTICDQLTLRGGTDFPLPFLSKNQLVDKWKLELDKPIDSSRPEIPDNSVSAKSALTENPFELPAKIGSVSV